MNGDRFDNAVVCTQRKNVLDFSPSLSCKRKIFPKEAGFNVGITEQTQTSGVIHTGFSFPQLNLSKSILRVFYWKFVVFCLNKANSSSPVYLHESHIFVDNSSFPRVKTQPLYLKYLWFASFRENTE